MSEHIELLSDAADQMDEPDMGVLNKEENQDPLVDAAMKEHQEQQSQLEQGKDDEVPLMDDSLDLRRNSFAIPMMETGIKCGISWRFLDENKLIDLDLIVTALDLHSFEMDSVNKDHKKMFKKSIVYNKNRKHKDCDDDKWIDLKLREIPANCHSLWYGVHAVILTVSVCDSASLCSLCSRFMINAYSGDSLKDVDKATFNIYAQSDDEDEDDSSDEEEQGPKRKILYSYDVGMGFDSSSILLGVLYRATGSSKEWLWTIVEEKNLWNNLILNNLHLIYDEKVIADRPNDRHKKCELKQSGERYVVDQNIEKLSIGLGWDLSGDLPDDEEVAVKDDDDADDAQEDAVKMVEQQNQKKEKVGAFELDIDVDGSIIVFGKVETEENEKGLHLLFVYKLYAFLGRKCLMKVTET